MNVGVLTSSRADFGIYLPLLNKFKHDGDINSQIIAFGTHCSPYHGKTIDEIREAGFEDIHAVSSLLVSDDEASIATSYGLTVIKFANYWAENNYDLVFCLGDRFEMSAAVQAGIPFGTSFAHLHGGETTLGAIDNIYRHQITQASELHFTSTEKHADKVRSLIQPQNNVYNIGALSLEALEEMKLLDEQAFRKKYGIPNGPYILTTFHPETAGTQKNRMYSKEMFEAINFLADDYSIVITMPNADTLGTILRDKIMQLKEVNPDKMVIVENFGKQNYFTAMKYARILLGNSSSGIIEAASFGKYVINVGDRQKGRLQSKNVVNCDFKKDAIIESVQEIEQKGFYRGVNIYRRERSSDKIIEAIKEYHATL